MAASVRFASGGCQGLVRMSGQNIDRAACAALETGESRYEPTRPGARAPEADAVRRPRGHGEAPARKRPTRSEGPAARSRDGARRELDGVRPDHHGADRSGPLSAAD